MATTKIKPVGKLILVEDVDQEESTTASGIVLPDTVAHNNPGDLVLVPFDSTGIPIESGDGREYFLVAVNNVLAKVT